MTDRCEDSDDDSDHVDAYAQEVLVDVVTYDSDESSPQVRVAFILDVDDVEEMMRRLAEDGDHDGTLRVFHVFDGPSMNQFLADMASRADAGTGASLASTITDDPLVLGSEESVIASTHSFVSRVREQFREKGDSDSSALEALRRTAERYRSFVDSLDERVEEFGSDMRSWSN